MRAQEEEYGEDGGWYYDTGKMRARQAMAMRWLWSEELCDGADG